ncbi:MAG TPA: hypothetical protein VLE47_03300, partial [Candidatus Saccharimonadales bacterium]|nr:hypothetical protein [Candidatus Saccharimonadales bacterium]
GFTITTLYALILYAQRQSPKRLAFLTLAFTAAILSKYSTFFLFAIVISLMLYIYKVRGERRFKHIFIMLCGSLLIIVLFYGLLSFRDRGLAGFSALTYFLGLGGTFGAVASTERFSYLLGESYTGGKLYYFPALIATKTQVLTLIGSMLGLFYLATKRLVLPKLELVIFFTPSTLFLALAMVSKFNIGLRHILPIYPFILIIAAAGFVALIHNIERVFHKSLALALVSLVLLIIIGGRVYSIATTYPHFLSYYNFIGGGTDNGWKVADDANYDWGQDVGRLADFVRENKINSLALDNYTGLYAARDYYNLPVKQFYPTQKDYKGYVALSTSAIVFHEDKADNYGWLINTHQPIAKAGKSIFIYKVE